MVMRPSLFNSRTRSLGRAALWMCLLVSAAPAGLRADPGPPRFFNYSSPTGVGDDSGEPSIGTNWTRETAFNNSLRSIPNGGTANYFGGFSPYMLNVIFND